MRLTCALMAVDNMTGCSERQEESTDTGVKCRNLQLQPTLGLLSFTKRTSMQILLYLCVAWMGGCWDAHCQLPSTSNRFTCWLYTHILVVKSCDVVASYWKICYNFHYVF